MELEFYRSYKAIKAFPKVVVPPFCVVIGINGSGKTQLLQAISNGSVRNSIATEPRQSHQHTIPHVRYLHSTALHSSFSVPTNNRQSQNSEVIHFQPFVEARRARLEPFLSQLEGIVGQPVPELINGVSVWETAPSNLAKHYQIGELIGEIEAVFNEAESSLLQKPTIPPTQWRAPSAPDPLAGAQKLCDRVGLSILTLNQQQTELYQHWGDDDLFSINLADVFHKYRDVQLRNWMLLKADEINATTTGIGQEEFLERFGQAPWDLINQNLRAFSLPYELTSPYLADFKQSPITFRRKDDGTDISFADLSSGERMLAQFAISSFQFDETFMTITRPKVLLLDEMDSSLHPEMTHRWLKVIENIFVEEQEMHCIVTTHSPTTVALTPENALYEMRGANEGLVKISKQEALNKLTFGVPTLSIDYQSRRQVFAESDTDAEIYERLYSIIKSHINCPMELNFISTGIRNKHGVETNSGCTIVRKLVNDMTSSGNRSVFGIVDWDGETVSTDRVKVIAEGIRDGVENVLLDPLLICLLLMKYTKAPSDILDISKFVAVAQLSSSNIQRLVDSIQRSLFCLIPTELITVKYAGGMTAQVSKEYLSIDDHELERRLCENFPFLNKWAAGGRGKLSKAIVDEVLVEYTEFCPQEIVSVFESISQTSV
ncbi:AAA family ATPase [Ochrobactrum sp. BTU1]|uniref:AAA family ATPase n=1 Tax=Ochrobactrum sp. BTU1 TaxID=2840456 RepID=UPI001C03C24F|nr:AAA family ATPase [Ochrobactrum sp. BTU1]